MDRINIFILTDVDPEKRSGIRREIEQYFDDHPDSENDCVMVYQSDEGLVERRQR